METATTRIEVLSIILTRDQELGLICDDNIEETTRRRTEVAGGRLDTGVPGGGRYQPI